MQQLGEAHQSSSGKRGYFLLSAVMLCSCSSRHCDASGVVPVLAGPDKDDENRGCGNDSGL